MNTLPTDIIALDTETQGLGRDAKLLGISWADASGSGAEAWTDESASVWSQRIEGRNVVMHNAAFDVPVLERNGLVIDNPHDTMVLAHVNDPSHESYSLRECAMREGTAMKQDFAPEDGWESAEWTDEMASYAEADAVATYELYHKYKAQLERDPKALRHYLTIEHPYSVVIREMERVGFTLDLPKLERVRQHLQRKAAGLERVMGKVAGFVPTPAKRYSNETLMGTYVTEEGGLIPAVTTYTTVRSGGACWVKDRALTKQTNREMKLFSKGETYLPSKFEKSVVVYEHCPLVPFNANSGAQIAERLTTLYGWEPAKFTKTGQPATGGEILEDLSYPLARMLTEYATTVKVLGSFIEPFSQKHDDGVLRGRFKQTGTRTGRLSSSDPNLQNIPTRSALGQHVRSLVIAPEGHVIVGIDLSNIEGRLLGEYLARIVGDFSMVEIFEAGIDFHQANADNWGVSRPDAKTLLYAVVYGAGPEKVGHGDKERGKKLMASLEKNAPGIFELKERIWEEARKRDGILHTLFGRRLVYSDIILDNAIETAKRLKKDKPDDYRDVSVKGLARSLVSRAERQIVNALLQGTAADVLKILTLEVRPQIHRANGMIAASVHDELLNYVPSDYAPWVRDQLTKAFTSDTMLKYAPITGDAAIGKSWKEVH